jgi:hypothetical protein
MPVEGNFWGMWALDGRRRLESHPLQIPVGVCPEKRRGRPEQMMS